MQDTKAVALLQPYFFQPITIIPGDTHEKDTA